MPIFETIQTTGVPVKIFTDEIDKNAKQQLIDLAESGIAVGYVSAMPDVHWGLGATVGSVFASDKYVCPNAVGVDIGCGMAAVPYLNLKKENLTLELKQKIHNSIKRNIPTGMESHDKEHYAPILDSSNITLWLSKQISAKTAKQIGTLGSGNHFIELVHDDTDTVWILLHSGSRNIGKVTAEYYNKLAIDQMKKKARISTNRDLNYFDIESEEGSDYLKDMSWCQEYALANRQDMLKSVADVVLRFTNIEPDWTRAINIHHNYCTCETCTFTDKNGNTQTKDLWITRKGATSAKENQLGIIPGSMGTGSYIVKGKGNIDSWKSCSHGAGRLRSRTASISDISQKDFEKSMEGIVCETNPELRDEAPQAYKNITHVMSCQSDLVEPVVRLSPLINVKGFDKHLSKMREAKYPAIFINESDFNLDITRIEIQMRSNRESQWSEIKDFKLRYDSSNKKSKKVLWVESKNHSKKLMIECIVQQLKENTIYLQILSIQKEKRL